MGANLDLRPLTYAAFNTLAAVGITFANKAVFAVFHFNYVYLLTFIHALATVAGMHGALDIIFSHISYSNTQAVVQGLTDSAFRSVCGGGDV